MARPGKPLHRPGDLVLRIRRHQAAQDADLVRPGRGSGRSSPSPAYGRPGAASGAPRARPSTGEHELFGFLTTEANAIVAPIHPKAMPVILTTPARSTYGFRAETADALALQRPLPDEALRIVAKGERSDGALTAEAIF